MGMLRFDIRYPDGRTETTVVEGERAMIGSSAHCDIRMPIDLAAPEHILIELVGETLRGQVRAQNPPALLNGMPFSNSIIPPGAQLTLGNVAMLVSPASGNLGGAIVKKKGNETSPLAKLVGILLIPAAAYMLLMDDDVATIPTPTQVPELFGGAVTACPQSTPNEAAAFASDKLAIADGKRERSPFVVQEGVAAVQLYEVAAACYRVAQDQAGADDSAQAAKALRQTLTSDFRARRIRLEHLLLVGDYALAGRDVTVLKALTAGKSGPYVAWLDSVQRDIRAKGPTP